MNPTALSSYGINLEDVRTALQQTSLNLAKGNFDGAQQDYQIDANDQLLTSKDFQKVVVAYHNGSPVVLSEVANVIDDVENVKQAAWMNLTPAVIVNIQRQPGANIIQVVDRIKKLSAAAANESAGSGGRHGSYGPHHDHSSVGERRRIRTDADRGAGGDGYFPFPAEYSGHDHSQRRRAAVAGGHLWRDVPGGLQPEQSDADGADDFHRVCGGRRHRDDRKHRPLHRGRRAAAGSGA